MTQLIKNGRLVVSVMDGIPYDLKQLDEGQLYTLSRLVSKQKTGTLLTADDVKGLIAVRKAARSNRQPTAHEKLRDSINDLKIMFSK